MELSLEGWIFDLQRARRGSQAEGDEERKTRRPEWVGPGQEQAQSMGGEKAGRRGRTCKAMLRSFDFLLRAMARLLKILEQLDDLMGFMWAEWWLPEKEQHQGRHQGGGRYRHRELESDNFL